MLSRTTNGELDEVPRSLLMKLTHSSLATIIGWMSTSLLAGGASTLFSESVRAMWMSWGCFGLAAAVGLDLTARARERRRFEAMRTVANRRFDHKMKYETDDTEANAAIRQAVAHLLGSWSAISRIATDRRAQQRFCCDLKVEMQFVEGLDAAPGKDGVNTFAGRITSLSDSGFELALSKPLPHRRMEMIITTPSGERQPMFCELLWSERQADGSFVAGGRFLDAAPIGDD